MTLDYSDIISIVLSSSLLAAGLTFFGNRWLQRDSYKRDYYKKLLDKRLEAYEAVENILGQLSRHSQLDDGRISPMICALGQDHFSHFLLSIMQAVSKSIWLGDKTGMKLTELNIFLLSHIDHKIDENEEYDSQLIELGAQQRDHIKSFRRELGQLLYKDLQSLHDIESFVKATKVHSPGFPLEAKPTPLQKQTDNDTTTHQG